MRLSIVINAYNMKNVLGQSVASVLEQSGLADDIEIIIVDDGSTDGTAELARTMSHRNLRVRCVPMPVNGGLPAARNAGIAAARGEYLTFLDGDDHWLPGYAAAVLRRIEPAGGVSVLVTNFTREFRCGLRRVDERVSSVPHLHDGVASANDHPELVDLSWNAWTKVVRTDFLRDSGLYFESGMYEDIAWGAKLLVAAPRVAVAPIVGVAYQRCQGHSLSSAVRRTSYHDLVLQTSRVERFLTAFDVTTDQVRDRVLAKLAREARRCLDELAARDEEQRRDFLDIMIASCPGTYKKVLTQARPVRRYR